MQLLVLVVACSVRFPAQLRVATLLLALSVLLPVPLTSVFFRPAPSGAGRGFFCGCSVIGGYAPDLAYPWLLAVSKKNNKANINIFFFFDK